MPEPLPGLLPVDDYVERILATVSPLHAFQQPLMEALGLALAEDVVAPISLPSFDNSAMDGYAVVAEDVADATEDAPVILPVVGEIGAGQSSILALSPGHRGQDHDRRARARRRDHRRALRVDRPRRRPGAHRPAPPGPASTSGRSATTSPRATCCSRRAPSWAPATSACSPPSAGPPCVPAPVRASWSSPPAPSCATPARRWATTRSTTATPTSSPPPPAPPVRSPTGSASSPTSRTPSPRR